MRIINAYVIARNGRLFHKHNEAINERVWTDDTISHYYSNSLITVNIQLI